MSQLPSASPGLCAHHPICPICKGPCPGVCIFAEGMESMQVMILVLDVENRRVVYENQAACTFLDKIGDHSYQGLNVLLMRDGGSFESLVENPSGDPPDPQDPRLSDFSFQRLSFRMDARIYGYSFYNAKGFVWIFLRDITERSHLEAIAASVEQMNSLGFIFSAVRHELGNPIHSIKSAVSVLRTGLDRLPRQRVADYLQSIEAELGRTETLLRSLKSFSLFESPELGTMHLPTFIDQLKPLIEPDLKARGIGLEIALPPDTPCVEADTRALNQIFINLITNAADNLLGQPAPCLRIQAKPGEGHVAVVLEDNGPGIPESHLPHMFTPFFTTKEHGTGLGLVIVKKLVTAMNGTVWMESVKPHGTRVVFTLESK